MERIVVDGEEGFVELKLAAPSVFVITLTGKHSKANAFSMEFIAALSRCLDIVEERAAESSPKAVVFTAKGSRFFSAGFDLGIMKKAPKENAYELVRTMWRFLARLLVFPAPTFALFNGHAFGAGLFLGLACDHRFMIDGNGKLCLPEINIGMSLGSGFAALVKCRMDLQTARVAALTGKQFSPKEALQAKIIDAVLTKDDTEPLDQVIAMAQSLAKTGKDNFLSAMKMELYGETYKILNSAIPKAKL